MKSRVPVYILAGGESRRYGSDKARADRGGTPQIVHVAGLVDRVSAGTTVVAGTADAYADLGLRTIGDVEPGRGPLGGLATAIADTSADGWILLLACDWVGLRREWAARLIDNIPEATQVICYKTERYEPLFALYHSSVREVVAKQMASGELAMHRLLDLLHLVTLPPPPGWDAAKNLNLPPD